jgi:hypothetical protein
MNFAFLLSRTLGEARRKDERPVVIIRCSRRCLTVSRLYPPWRAIYPRGATHSEADCIDSINRYIVNPGQATAYKIGMIKILELREKAKKQLGSKFDIRDFHNVVLSNGAVPLDMLEQLVERWIKSRQ